MLAEKLNLLKKDIVDFAAVIEKMVKNGIDGLLKKDKKMLLEIIEKLEEQANKYDVEIDAACTNMIAQYEPKARDLRSILMILKMGNDLERMGDHAVNIAQSALDLIDKPAVKPFLDLPRMSELVNEMLRNSINAFINWDAKLGKAVCESDDAVDSLRDQILRELITYMTADPSTTERALHLINIARNLERIADLTTNIGEEVLYMVEGRVIKHHSEEKK